MIIKNVKRNKKTYKKEDKYKSKKNRNTRLLDLKKGDKVIYKRENIKEEVIISDIHTDDPEDIYLTIEFSDGTQRQTISKYISISQ